MGIATKPMPMSFSYISPIFKNSDALSSFFVIIFIPSVDINLPKDYDFSK